MEKSRIQTYLKKVKVDKNKDHDWIKQYKLGNKPYLNILPLTRKKKPLQI